MSVTNEQVEKTLELFEIADNIKGIRKVTNLYGAMASSEFIHLVISDVDKIDGLITQLNVMKENLKPNEKGARQFGLMINSAENLEGIGNPVFYMDNPTKNGVIDAFKATLPLLDNGAETEYTDKKAELDAL